uniref:Thioredoxin domain-containing protein n=1 Tax=Caenorhabditis japonica TaxID=281687 RepID=A0A8R1DJ24_CAEJA
MLLPRLDELRRALTAYHLLNTILAVAFPVIRSTFLCDYVFAVENGDKCEIDSREREILMFLVIILMWKGRKTTNWMHFVGNIFLFSKIAGMFLFVRAEILAGIIYVLACLVITVLCPEPAYTGPEQITYFQGDQLYEELAKNRNTIWVIQFFTTWSPECKHVHPVFAELSEKYTLSNLKFGKLDIGRWASEGERFRVNAHPMSRQLPTICVFKDAKEISRRPLVNENRRAVPFVFSQENCVLAFDLLNLYNEQRQQKSGGKTKSE